MEALEGALRRPLAVTAAYMGFRAVGGGEATMVNPTPYSKAYPPPSKAVKPFGPRANVVPIYLLHHID